MSSFTQDFACPICGSQGLRTVWVNTSMRWIKYTEECTSMSCNYIRAREWEPVDDPIEGYDPHVVLPSLDDDAVGDL